MQRRKPLKRTRMKKKPKKDRRTPEEKAYYVWLATQPAMDTGGECEVRHHPRFQRYGAGTSKKAKDWYALPITNAKHDFFHLHPLCPIQHGWIAELWQRYGRDRIPAEVREKLMR